MFKIVLNYTSILIRCCLECYKNVNISCLQAVSVHRILFLVMLFAYSLTRTTPLVDSRVILPNCFHTCPLLVYTSCALLQWTVSRFLCPFCCGLIQLVFLDRGVNWCDFVVAMGCIVLCEVCIRFVTAMLLYVLTAYVNSVRTKITYLLMMSRSTWNM
jgi:hypothetical protein